VINTALVAANERTVPMPGYGHKGICRHVSAGDNGLKLILFQIKDILQRDAVENISDQVIMHTPARVSELDLAKGSYGPFKRNPVII
jgi:hypothetical protein